MLHLDRNRVPDLNSGPNSNPHFLPAAECRCRNASLTPQPPLCSDPRCARWALIERLCVYAEARTSMHAGLPESDSFRAVELLHPPIVELYTCSESSVALLLRSERMWPRTPQHVSLHAPVADRA
eukprot:6207021-Pleurochrysis_carterae.AAC.1